MFLDEELYQTTKAKNVTSVDDFIDLLTELQTICNKRYIEIVIPGAFKKDIKSAIDRTFKSWDLFAERLTKENYLFAAELTKYSYKYCFMNTANLKKVYETL